MKKVIFAAIPILLVVIGGITWFAVRESGTSSTEEKKAPHLESSTPASGMVLAAPPPNVTIDFNFDLADGSSIEIAKDGSDYGSDETTIDENKLAMRRGMRQGAPDGMYLVTYNACWPDGSCHDGQFSFQVDRAAATNFIDMRGQKEVTVRMSQIMFTPMDLLISKGTEVTWVNDDDVVHYVNTDSHPAHTHTPGLNSKALNKGDSYTFIFDETGSYPYHCSAHASTMTGTVVVE